MKIENKEKLNKVIIMDVGHVKQVLNDDEKFILEKYSLYKEYLNNKEVTFEFALKYIDAIMKQAEKDSVGLMYLIVGYGSSGFGGIIKKSLIKILEKGVYKKLIRKWLTVSNHHTYVDALNNVNTKHGIIKLYTRFSCEDDQKLCYFMNDDKAELAFINTDKVYAYPRTFILPEKVKFEDKYCELTKINKSVFSGEYISSIFIPKSVIDIDDYAFFSCRIVKSFLFESESNLKRIGDTAFGSAHIANKFIIPKSVTEIARSAFNSFKVEKEIILESGSILEHIGARAFEKCINLYDIMIPKTVMEIGHHAFSESGLKNIVFEEGIKISTIEEGLFDGPRSSLVSVTIPKSVIEIKDRAFYRCHSLKTIYFEAGSNLKKIGKFAFAEMSRLSNLTIPKSVLEIDEYAFYRCTNLVDVNFENESQLEIIQKGAFERCESLLRLYFQKNIKMIYDYAFYECTKLNHVEFEEGSKLTICSAPYVFCGCNNLKLPEVPFENR